MAEGDVVKKIRSIKFKAQTFVLNLPGGSQHTDPKIAPVHVRLPSALIKSHLVRGMTRPKHLDIYSIRGE